MKIHIKGGAAGRSRQNGVDRVQDRLHRRRARSPRVGEGAREASAPTATIDASGLVVCPGLVDLSARLREPGFEYKATLESRDGGGGRGRRHQPRLPARHRSAARRAGAGRDAQVPRADLNRARVYPLGALTQGCKGERLTEMAELARRGCVAFSQADAPIADHQVLLPRAAVRHRRSASRCGCGRRTAALARRRRRARRRGRHAPGPAADSGLSPKRSRSRAILLLARETGARVHLCRVCRARRASTMVRAAPSATACAVTCDVGVHHAAPVARWTSATSMRTAT